MIYLNDDFCMRGLNQIPDIFDHPDKICNLTLYRPIVFLCSGEKPREQKD